MSLRVGVIGVGYLGRHHARILAGMPEVELVAVLDIDESQARNVAAETGARVETKTANLMGDVDAVTIAVPTHAHEAVAIPFLEAGIPVLVEKPIAPSVEQADAMLKASELAGTIFAVGHSERHNPAVVAALPLVTHPKFVEVHRLSTFSSRSLDIDVVFDVMIHDLDVLLACVKSEPISVEAVGVSVLSGHSDIANARIQFENGCIANLTASRISRERVRKIRFFQRDAYISVDCAAQQVEAWNVTREPGKEPVIQGGALELEAGEPLELELADFVASVVERKEPEVKGQDGRMALALADRIATAVRKVEA